MALLCSPQVDGALIHVGLAPPLPRPPRLLHYGEATNVRFHADLKEQILRGGVPLCGSRPPNNAGLLHGAKHARSPRLAVLLVLHHPAPLRLVLSAGTDLSRVQGCESALGGGVSGELFLILVFPRVSLSQRDTLLVRPVLHALGGSRRCQHLSQLWNLLGLPGRRIPIFTRCIRFTPSDPGQTKV